MANEACRLDPNNGAAEYARVLSQIANTTRLIHPAVGCPRSCYAVPVTGQPFALPNSFQLSGFVSGVTPAGTFKPAKPCGTCRGQTEECEEYSDILVSVTEQPTCLSEETLLGIGAVAGHGIAGAM